MKKIVFSIICMILLVYMICPKVCSYSIEDVKKKVEFTEIPRDKEPEKYDIMIKADDLRQNEHLPLIEYTVEDVLYSEQDAYDIDLLNENSTNTNENWKKGSNLVRVIFKISLYVAIVVMLTLLIYIAIVLVMSTISAKDIKAPFWNAFNRRSKNPLKASFKRGFIEEWIKGLLVLVCMVYVINFITYFSEYLTKQISEFKLEDEDKEEIVVYVKGSQMVDSEDFNSFSSVMPASSSGKYMFIGDSRTVGMKDAVGGTDDIFICKSSQGYDWMVNEAFPKAEDQIKSGMVVVIWMGVNDLDDVDKYIQAVNDKAEEWTEKGATIYYASVGPVDDSKSKFAKNSSIEGFNKKLKKDLSSNVKYVDVYTEINSPDLKTDNEGIHYNEDTYRNIYSYIKGEAPSTNSTSTNNYNTKQLDYTFKTNLEGFLLFQSQYRWGEFTASNILYIVSGGFLSLFKAFLDIFFIVRIIFIGFIIAFSPIVVLINAFQRILGNKGFMKRWFALYIFFIFVKTLIELLYFTLIKCRVHTAVEFPFYTFLITLLIFAIIIISLRMIGDYVFNRKNKFLGNLIKM